MPATNPRAHRGRGDRRVAAEHDVVVTHGNGPQVGLLALQGEAYDEVDPYPLDVLGAEAEGMIGYLLEQELVNELRDSRVATLLTQVVVDGADPRSSARRNRSAGLRSRGRGTRGSGARMDAGADGDGQRPGRRLARAARDRRAADDPAAGRKRRARGLRWRRRDPVLLDDGGRLRGVEAVIDKDLAAALLARSLEADALLLLTDVPAIEVGWALPGSEPLGEVTSAELRAIEFQPGSMGPKVEAACRFAEATGGWLGSGARRRGGDPARRARDPSQPRELKRGLAAPRRPRRLGDSARRR